MSPANSQAAPATATPPAPPTVSPAIPPETQWSCHISRWNEQGGPAGELDSELTVGQKFHLGCEGPSVDLKKDTLRLELTAATPYALRILETRSLTPSQADFIAATYLVGDVELKDPILTDGNRRVNLGTIQFKSASVITPQNNPENKPFPPWAPVAMGLPLYVWIAIAVLLLIAGSAATVAVRRSLQRRRLLAMLAKNATALSPFNQFNKDLRRLGRQFPAAREWSPETTAQYISELDRGFRWYLARELVIPALDSRPRSLVREVRKVDRTLHKEVRRELQLALTELEKALAAQQKVSSEDAQQLSELCRSLADRIAKSVTKTRSA